MLFIFHFFLSIILIRLLFVVDIIIWIILWFVFSLLLQFRKKNIWWFGYCTIWWNINDRYNTTYHCFFDIIKLLKFIHLFDIRIAFWLTNMCSANSIDEMTGLQLNCVLTLLCPSSKKDFKKYEEPSIMICSNSRWVWILLMFSINFINKFIFNMSNGKAWTLHNCDHYLIEFILLDHHVLSTRKRHK